MRRPVAVPTFTGWVFTGIYLGRAWLSAERLLSGQPPEVREMIFEWADAAHPVSKLPLTVDPELLSMVEA
jgi:hypothetical protein